jgi:hypothetical protein
MKNFKTFFTSIWSGVMPPVAIPKVPNKQVTVPGFAKQITPTGSA